MDNSIDPFKVYVRVRPLLDRELILIEEEETKKGKIIPKLIVTSEENKVLLKDPNNLELYGKNIKIFPFDRVFTENEDNKDIFDSVLVDNILKGYNSTALAYGVTGAGKTHTMLGDMNSSNLNNRGISLYAVDYLFNQINFEKEKVFTTKISYLEIYNEQVIDLLTTKPSIEGIMIVEDPNKGVLVPDLTEIVVKNSNQVMNYITKGNSRRIKASTSQNQFSSRSHAILQINIEQCSKNIEKDEILISKMLLVDLAGSEKGSKERGIRRDEGSNINKSLLALGNCINILSDKTKKGAFVPYRDSKLTRLLKDSLGGNISTIVIACVSPFALTYEETHSTLKYASRANKIEKKITRNYKEIDQCTGQYREMISSLRSEINRLKDIIHNQNMKIKSKGTQDDEHYKGSSYGDLISSKQDECGTYDDFINFNEENNTLDNSYTPSKEISNDVDLNAIIIDFSSEVYENILKKDLNNITDSEFDDLEKKLDSLCYDKITLEDKIKKGLKDLEINEKYAQIKSFYEKFIDVLNDQLAKNTEQNMIIKFQLKAIMDTEERNENNLLEIKDRIFQESEIGNNREEYKRLIKKRRDYETENKMNKEKRNNLKLTLEKNIKVKSFLKKLMLKFISNTQVNEFRDLQSMLTSLSNDKRELEVKTKKYHECFNSIIKENEVNSQELFTLSNELEKTKLMMISQDDKILELEAKIAEMEILKQKNEKARSPFTKSLIYVRHNNFEDNTNSPRGLINSDKKSIHSSHNSKNHHRSTSERNALLHHKYNHCHNNINNVLNNKRSNVLLLSNQNSNDSNLNNRINMNYASKIPTITAFIQGEEIYSHDSTLAKTISNLKYNLAVNRNTKIVNMSPSKSPSMRDTKLSDSLLKLQMNKKITPSTLIGNINYKGIHKNGIKDSHSLSNLHMKTSSKDKYNNLNPCLNSDNIDIQKHFQPCISPTKKITFGISTEPSMNRNSKWSNRCQKKREGSHSSNNGEFSSSCKNETHIINTSGMLNNININSNIINNNNEEESEEKICDSNLPKKHVKNKTSNVKLNEK